jgi:putative nucleotidyltransferase with HDIG domain
VFGYAILIGTNLLGIWMAVMLFLLPAVWRQYILRGVVESQRVSDSLIRAIARTVDEKDLYTGGHSANVAEIAAEIAREMGKSESFVETIEDAAIRHDLGKASWPNQVLRKSASFDDKELELYKWTHPDVGAEIAALSGSSPEVTEMIRCHHEYHDGGGYRRGISGDQIPLGARIISMADAFDAMIHDRSHRDRLSIGQALSEIRRYAGTQFDPQVADAFFRIVNRIDLEELAVRIRLDTLERPKRNTSGSERTKCKFKF